MEEKEGYDDLISPDEVHPSIRDLKLFYFQPESAPENFSGILYGQRRTGKTTWLVWFLWCMQGRFDHVVCFSATNFTGTYSSCMNEKLCYNGFDEEVMASVLRIQAENPQKRILVILDDVLDQENVLRKSASLKTLFTMGRHRFLGARLFAPGRGAAGHPGGPRSDRGHKLNSSVAAADLRAS